MALQSKVTFQGIDKAGLVIQIANTTGNYNAITNPGGFGGPNTAISEVGRVVFTLSQYSIREVYEQTYTRVADPAHPEWNLIPTITQIASGVPVEVSSISLGLTEIPIPFEDGVFDLNMYTVLTSAKNGVVGGKGNPFINGQGLDAYLSYDSVVVGNDIYDIDKTKGTAGGTILFLVQEIQTTFSSFNPAYRANAKFMTTASTTECLKNSVGKMASNCGCTSEKDKQALYDVQMFIWAAGIALENGDMVNANSLVVTAGRLCNSLKCNC